MKLASANAVSVTNVWQLIDYVLLIRQSKRSDVALDCLFLDGGTDFDVKSTLNIVVQRNIDEIKSRKSAETHYLLGVVLDLAGCLIC